MQYIDRIGMVDDSIVDELQYLPPIGSSDFFCGGLVVI